MLPTTACTPASIASNTFAGAASGVVKSTITSAPSRTSLTEVSSAGSARPTSSMSSAPSTASQVVSPIRPAAPETTTLIGSAIGRSYWDGFATPAVETPAESTMFDRPKPLGERLEAQTLRLAAAEAAEQLSLAAHHHQLELVAAGRLDLEADRGVVEDPGGQRVTSRRRRPRLG